jgi:predicted RNA-binding protein YlxR (DUF448 family)
MDKKAPERMCIVCRNMFTKDKLIRVVRDKESNYFLDTTFKANGRGAYICKTEECISKCFKKKLLNKAFKTNISEEIYAKLWSDYESIKG